MNYTFTIKPIDFYRSYNIWCDKKWKVMRVFNWLNSNYTIPSYVDFSNQGYILTYEPARDEYEQGGIVFLKRREYDNNYYGKFVNFDDIYIGGLGGNFLSKYYDLNLDIDQIINNNQTICCDKEWKANILLKYFYDNTLDEKLLTDNYWNGFQEKVFYTFSKDKYGVSVKYENFHKGYDIPIPENVINFDDICKIKNIDYSSELFKLLHIANINLENYYLSIMDVINKLVDNLNFYSSYNKEDDYSLENKTLNSIIILINRTYCSIVEKGNSIHNLLERANYKFYESTMEFYSKLCLEFFKIIFEEDNDSFTIDYNMIIERHIDDDYFLSSPEKELYRIFLNTVIKHNYYELNIQDDVFLEDYSTEIKYGKYCDFYKKFHYKYEGNYWGDSIDNFDYEGYWGDEW